MTIKYNDRGLLFFIVILSLIIGTACNVKDPTEGLEVRLKTISRTTQISVDIIDAATNQRILKPVTVTFEGENKHKVINDVNEMITSDVADSGIVLFSLDDAITPTNDNPFKLILVFDVSGYIKSSIPINVIQSGFSNFEIALVSLTNPPAGVIYNEVAQGSATSSAGTNQNLVVSSGIEPNSGANASISIPAGTVLLDKNGNPLSGNISTRITYFNPIDESSLRSFPGGFNVSVENQSGVTEDGFFTTAGFVAIDMTVGGNPVEGFSSPVQIDMDIPTGTLNQAGNPIQPGDLVPLWSLDEDVGTWRYETEVTVALPNRSGSCYQISYDKLKHLSYFNLDYFGNGGCRVGAWLRFYSNDHCFNSIRYNEYRLADNKYISWGYGSSYEPLLRIKYGPPFPVYLKVYDYYDYYYGNRTQIGYVEITEPCNSSMTYSCELSPLPTTNKVEVEFTVTARCDNTNPPGVVNLDGYPIYAKRKGQHKWFPVGTLDNGKITICLDWMKEYYFMTKYKGRWYYSYNYNNGQAFLIDHTNFSFTIENEPEVCNDF